ncbi:hypothetical protein B0H11DRAFT_1921285 [Mycena galericulata]|nr:hypothetical protein B0H11DRAFT_1921285 [Mycena galericulata]
MYSTPCEDAEEAERVVSLSAESVALAKGLVNDADADAERGREEERKRTEGDAEMNGQALRENGRVRGLHANDARDAGEFELVALDLVELRPAQDKRFQAHEAYDYWWCWELESKVSRFDRFRIERRRPCRRQVHGRLRAMFGTSAESADGDDPERQFNSGDRHCSAPADFQWPSVAHNVAAVGDHWTSLAKVPRQSPPTFPINFRWTSLHRIPVRATGFQWLELEVDG